MSKFYVHSKVDGMTIFGKYRISEVNEVNGAFLPDGTWMGSIVVSDVTVLERIEKEEGLTIFPPLHAPDALTPTHAALLSHINAKAGDAMWKTAKALAAKHPDVPSFRPEIA